MAGVGSTTQQSSAIVQDLPAQVREMGGSKAFDLLVDAVNMFNGQPLERSYFSDTLERLEDEAVLLSNRLLMEEGRSDSDLNQLIASLSAVNTIEFDPIQEQWDGIAAPFRVAQLAKVAELCDRPDLQLGGVVRRRVEQFLTTETR